MLAEVELKEIEKSFGSLRVLDRLSLTIGHDERTLLLGRNGSGKSTLLRICSGLSKADRGEVAHLASNRHSMSSLGYSGHELMLYGQLSVRENLQLTKGLRSLKLDIEELCANWELSGKLEERVDSLSAGLAKKVSLCRALMHKPKLILLDEPTSNLDDKGSEILLKNLEGASVLIATHDIARLAGFAQRALHLRGGKIAADSVLCSGGMSEVVSDYRSLNR